MHDDHTRHAHSHSHPHANPSDVSEHDRSVALLTYMLDHNRSHAQELHEVADSLSGESAALIHEAVDLFNKGNEKLADALRVLKEE